MKYIAAAAVLSCLLFVEASPASSSSKNTGSSVTASMSSLDPLSGAGYSIKVDSDDKDEDQENSPALAIVVAAHEEQEEQEENEESEESEKKESSVVDKEVDENVFASAGLVYNKAIDLPVYRQGRVRAGDNLPPVPQVVACRADGQVAITYSEGPSDATARIARHLNNGTTPGNFFVNTTWLNQQKYAMVLQNIYNAGHLIGMTYRLPNEDPEAMSDEEIKTDIINSARMIETLIQVSPKYVRLHFSAQSDGRTEQILRDLGFIIVGYNLDGKDYVHKTPELVANEYERTFKEYRDAHDSKGSFVAIQYDIPETTSMDAVPSILETIESQGYTAVRMDGCLNDARPYKASAAGLEYVADKFSFGSSGYKSGQQVKSIIANTTAEQELRVLAVDDEFLEKSDASTMLSKKIGFALIPALIYAFFI
ncbi:uncharacterized protein EV154DRAFT_598524 [Mucor mucedo]|uniref:uncharacterized protein n=1 Tax=Mucor mucedo TaxID=29922 RepID=UPI00221EF8E9|nr:uncharacterized protein EV154DRAFT_598524 [Mucor mucedo]KAI7896244.1 hypothetical protein EV154DRAFT_598524 [Mucor mucedo]